MNDTAALAVFLAGSAAILWVSRASLTRPGSHGFWRFFAWEMIVALVILTLPAWFHDPFSARQIVSWALLAASAILAGHGIGLLIREGRPSKERKDPGLFNAERTTRLITTGAYRFIRHPIFGSMILLAWGAFLKNPNFVTGDLAAAATVLLALTARAEEAEDIAYFGDQYREYMRHTKMFIPGIW